MKRCSLLPGVDLVVGGNALGQLKGVAGWADSKRPAICWPLIARRVLIVTDYDEVHWRAAAIEAGDCGYVLKQNLLEVRRFLEPVE